jgi:micrococcal nuclease
MELKPHPQPKHRLYFRAHTIKTMVLTLPAARLCVSRKLCVLLAAGLATASVWAAPQEQIAIVTRVSDGDTLWIRPLGDGGKQRPIKLRLQGLDAPERCQAWGSQAQQALAHKVLNKEVRLQTRGRDDHERVLGNVWLGDEDVSAWMVEAGHAWSYRYRRSLGPYAAQENQARQNKRGLFADPRAIEPREFRKSNGPCP